MDFEKDEKQLLEMLEPLKQATPPSEVMKDFEEDLFRKIKAADSGSNVGVFLIVGFAIAFAVALGLAFLLTPKPEKTQEIKEAVVVEEVTPEVIAEEMVQQVNPSDGGAIHELPLQQSQSDVHNDAVVETEEDIFEEIDVDLFILEMLGEETGFLDDFDAMEADLETFHQLSPPMTGVRA